MINYELMPKSPNVYVNRDPSRLMKVLYLIGINI